MSKASQMAEKLRRKMAQGESGTTVIKREGDEDVDHVDSQGKALAKNARLARKPVREQDGCPES